MPWASCPDQFTCAEGDGSGGVAETEGVQVRREDAGVDMAATAEESRRAGCGSDRTAFSSTIYRDSCWCRTGTWIMDRRRWWWWWCPLNAR